MTTPGSLASQVPAGDAAVMRRLEAIERWQREALPSVASSFAPVIASLQAQQADLQAQADATDAVVAGLATLVGEQVTGATGTANSGVGGTSLTTSATSYALVTIAVPTGYTRAVVSGASNCYYVSTGGIEVQVDIGGSVGYTQILTNGQSSGGATHAASLTGLSGSFTVASRARLQSGTGTAYFVTTATAIFLR